MEKILEFIAQGKDSKFSGKKNILHDLRIGNDIILTIDKDANGQIIVQNLDGEKAGCIPFNPQKKTEYELLSTAIEHGNVHFVHAKWHSDFYFKVQIAITTNTN